MQYIINLIPSVFNIALLPLWYLESTYGFWTFGNTSFCELILNGVLFPILLLIFNLRFIHKQEKSLLAHLLMMVISIICSAFAHYFNWGIVTGNFFKPDDMTIGLVLFVDVLFPLAFVILGVIIYAIFKTRRKFIHNASDNDK